MSDAALTPKQAQFVVEYLIDLNATQAAIRAGYSPNTAREQASRLLDRPHVQAAIDAGKVGRSERTAITADRVLGEIASMAFYDPAEIMLEITNPGDGDVEPVRIGDNDKLYGLRGPSDIRRLPEDVRRAIVGWGYDRNQNFTIKLADKSKALDQLARHLALYNDSLRIGGLEGLADRLDRAVRRPADDAMSSAKIADRLQPSRPQTAPKPVLKAEPQHNPAAVPLPVKPAYEPILPPFPERQAFALSDYDPAK
jgi:phage terminase small subunit